MVRLKKFILIFFGLIIFLILENKVNASQPLVVNPYSLSLSIPSGRLDTSYVEVANLGNTPILVESLFDSDWMLLLPSEFKLEAKETRRVLTIFFVKRGEEPQREGKIIFKTKNSQKQASIKVNVINPMKAREEEAAKAAYAAQIEEEQKKNEEIKQKIKQEMADLEEKIKYFTKCLKEELQKEELEEMAKMSESPKEKRSGKNRS